MNLELLNRHIGAALYHQVEAAKHTPAPPKPKRDDGGGQAPSAVRATVKPDR